MTDITPDLLRLAAGAHHPYLNAFEAARFRAWLYEQADSMGDKTDLSHQQIRNVALEEAARIAEARIGVAEPGIREEEIRELDKEAQDIATIIRSLKRYALKGGVPQVGKDAKPVAWHDGIADLIVRDVCELDPADPNLNDTICIDVSDLLIIAKRHTEVTQQPAIQAARTVPNYKPEWLRSYAKTVREQGVAVQHGTLYSAADCLVAFADYLDALNNRGGAA